MMTRAASLVLGASILLLGPNMALAESCPEGRTMMGECLNPGLASTMRQNAIVYSQSQLSQTAQPIMPQEDYTYRYPHALTTTPPQGQGGVTPVPTPVLPIPPPDID
jgi:hypothetical protein